MNIIIESQKKLKILTCMKHIKKWSSSLYFFIISTFIERADSKQKSILFGIYVGYNIVVTTSHVHNVATVHTMIIVFLCACIDA